MTPEEQKSLIRSIYDPKIGFDIEKFYAHAAADMVFIRPPFPPVVGAEANRKSDEALLAAFSGYTLVIEEVLAEGDKVVMSYVWKGVHTGTLPTLGIPATGKAVEAPGCIIFHFKEDKIVKSVDYFDMLGFMQQLGLIPAAA
jgi:steroid delta-isomerase-like uncharacterized protein